MDNDVVNHGKACHISTDVDLFVLLPSSISHLWDTLLEGETIACLI